MIDSCGPLVIVGAAEDLGREREKSFLPWLDSLEAEDEFFGFAS
jgi:hypothetical protein